MSEIYWTIFTEESIMCVKWFPDVKFIFEPTRCATNEKDYLFAKAATKFQHLMVL